MSAEQHDPPATGDLVLVGSSAGGIEALSVLVSSLPADFPAPIVLAQHLDPNRPSSLAPILERRSALPVVVVKAHTPIEPGTIYVVPSNRHVTISDGHIELEGDHRDRPRPSVDLLLSSAAHSYAERLIAVILTGSGSDGAAGALDVKEAGGTVIIQNPQTARYPSMPMALPPTGVDHVVDLEQIGPLLYDIVKGQHLPEKHANLEDGLPDILAMVSHRTNIGFQSYKPSTILRRIGRRMAVTHTHSLREYAHYLEANPQEIAELVMAFLIKVTEFFRDPEAFAYIREQIIPKLVERARHNGQSLRFWSAGCATGEEPYSLALLLADHLGAELPMWNIKIFATDLDEGAIDFARRSLYPRNMLRNLPPGYLERFFEPADEGYRVAKRLRQMIIFGQQDLGRGAPFPRIDLVICRNLLIYFKPELQEYVLDLFAYSLHQVQGYLFLGKAETARPSRSIFELIDKRWKVYRCVSGPVHLPSQKDLITVGRSLASRHRAVAPAQRRIESEPAPTPFEPAQLRRFNETLLRSLPVGVVVIDRSYRIVTLNASARRLLGIRDMAGDQDFLHTMRGLPYQQVRAAIDAVSREHTSITLPELELDSTTSGAIRFVSLTIMPMLADAEGPDLMVITVSEITEQVQIRQQLEEVQAEQAQLVTELGVANRRLNDLNKELQDANEELQASNEELMLAQEELQATNEEFEATNEELQATNEELETNNEELQAANEELETTNDELQARTIELQELARMLEGERGRLSEMVELAPFYIMVLRGPGLRVESFNPRYARLLEGQQPQGWSLEEVIELFWHGGREIVDLAREVYRDGAARTSPRMLALLPGEAGQPAEVYFVYTIVPSHDADGSVDGVIVYAADVTEQWARQAEEERAHLKLIFDHTDQVALALYDAGTGELLLATPHYLSVVERAYGIDPGAAIGRAWRELAFVAPGEQALELWNATLERRTALRLPEARVRLAQDEQDTVWDWSLTPIMDPEKPDTVAFMLVSAIEITGQVQARAEMERLDRLKDEFLSLASHELRTPLTPLIGYADMLNRLLAGQADAPSPDRDARMRRIAEKFGQQLKRMNQLIEDLVDIGRLQSGKFSMKQERVDLAAVLEQAVEEAHMLDGPQTIRLKLLPPDERPAVCGDRDRLLQVVSNLLQNAITYASNSEWIDVRLSRVPQADGQVPLAQIDVQDYGSGIAPEAQAALFTRFYQVARGERPGRGGLGLGLFICKQIVEQHGGTIVVDSTVGEGSTFIVRLPLLEAEGQRLTR